MCAPAAQRRVLEANDKQSRCQLISVPRSLLRRLPFSFWLHCTWNNSAFCGTFYGQGAWVFWNGWGNLDQDLVELADADLALSLCTNRPISLVTGLEYGSCLNTCTTCTPLSRSRSKFNLKDSLCFIARYCAHNHSQQLSQYIAGSHMHQVLGQQPLCTLLGIVWLGAVCVLANVAAPVHVARRLPIQSVRNARSVCLHHDADLEQT